MGTLEGDETVRDLAVGDVVELVTSPEEAKIAARLRVRCRVLGDSTEGWFTMRAGILLPCEKRYLVLRVTKLLLEKMAGSGEVTTLKVGDTVDLLEGPLEGLGGGFWIKAKCKNHVGWAPLADGKGQVLELCRLSSSEY